MKRILVTGATGFIGRHTLLPLIERGFEVHVVSRTQPGSGAPSDVVWHPLDLLDPVATDAIVRDIGGTHLLHLAWYAEHGKFWDALENLDWVAASLGLLRSFHRAGGQRAVFAGTCAEYDWTDDCCTDATGLEPATLYGVSKHALHRLADGLARETGMSVAWGRVFFTYGPGEQPTRVIASVARALASGETIPCSTGTQARDFLYVEDVASAFAALVDSAVRGALDIGSGRAVAVRDVLARLERLAGRAGLVRFGEAPQRLEPDRIVAHSRRLQDEVGWMPTYALDEGLERTLSWWRDAASHHL